MSRSLKSSVNVSTKDFETMSCIEMIRISKTSNKPQNDENNGNNNEENQTRSGTQHTSVTRWNLLNTRQIEVSLANFSQQMRTWLLLDNQSTDDIFCNSQYLIDIKEIEEILEMSTNGGILKTNMKGIFPGYCEVWY